MGIGIQVPMYDFHTAFQSHLIGIRLSRFISGGINYADSIDLLSFMEKMRGLLLRKSGKVDRVKKSGPI